MRRRDFVKGALGAAGLGGLGALGFGALGQEKGEKAAKEADGVARVTTLTAPAPTPIEKRAVGKTGFQATILGFGGYPISEGDAKQGLLAIETALEEGINYFDTASTYGSHTSESYLGRVLPDLDRRSFFLATKTLERTRATAEKEIAESLKRLRVAPDLLQLHAVNDVRTLDAVMAKGGSFEAALAAKEAGKVRFLGITGHTHPDAVAKALDRYPFDTVLIPLGAPDHHLRSFEDVMRTANEKGAAVIAMKVLSGGRAPGKVPVEPLFEYAWNLPVATAIVGMRSRDEVQKAARAARAFRPLSEERVAEILALAKPLGTAETLWWKRV